DVLARVYNDLGRLLDGDRARDAYRRGLAANPRDRVIVVRLLNNLGNLERDESDLAEAVRLYERARTLARKIGDKQGRLAAEHNIGLVYAQQNDPKRALDYLRRALTIEPRSARTLLSISEAHRALGENDEALRVLARARNAARDDLTRATILLREADLRVARDDVRGAERDLDASLRLDPASRALVLAYRAKLRLAQKRDREAAALATEAATSAMDLDTITQAQSIAGVAYRRAGNTVAAKRAFVAAIDAIERERKLVAGNRESRQRFFEREVFPYVAMMELLVDGGDAQRALEFAERAKARVLVEALRARAQTRVSASQENVVEYAVAGSRLFAFVVSGERTRVVELPRVDELANRFAREIAQRNLAFRKTARALYDAIVAPLALDGMTRVCIVPDGELWRVPFQALIDAGDRYLVERMTIFYAPSIAALREMSRVPAKPGGTLLAAGNLPEADTELRALRDVYGAARTTLQTRATESAIKREAPHHDVLHFAAHGVFDDASPLESYLALVDGDLTAREMMALDLDASLVVLSACETAAGRQAPGEGVIGMSWALSIAGCPTMIASQWDVESASTTRLMLAFHRAYAGGAAPADALRNAQLALLHTPRY
ncbi:MAG TPA: CHAT domain-containing protein, partial [Thermoanaerobaculia bacterium]|nr:CHAT domain-containing protein [Thermoanaerobaculia bacterium]